ncbi:hypothetical protein HMPREF9374_0054 [Desmospora sp. 8437]|nr:hypothetical protein HMPREF9374_0054 [Desmospora sp. 8437]
MQPSVEKTAVRAHFCPPNSPLMVSRYVCKEPSLQNLTGFLQPAETWNTFLFRERKVSLLGRFHCTPTFDIASSWLSCLRGKLPQPYGL